MKNIIFIIAIISLTQCSATNKNEKFVNDLKQKVTNFILSYQIDNDTTSLDSALYYTNFGLTNYDKGKIFFTFRKIYILKEMQGFPQAISFIKTIDFPIFSNIPYYNKYLLNRYEAMNYQLEGNWEKRDECLKVILADIEQFMSLNKDSIDSIYKTKDYKQILKNPMYVIITQYYLNKSALYGVEKMKLELDSIKNANGENPELYESLTDIINADFMDFTGI